MTSNRRRQRWVQLDLALAKRRKQGVEPSNLAQLAKAIDKSYVHVSRLANGHARPSDEILALIAEALDVPVSDLDPRANNTDSVIVQLADALNMPVSKVEDYLNMSRNVIQFIDSAKPASDDEGDEPNGKAA